MWTAHVTQHLGSIWWCRSQRPALTRADSIPSRFYLHVLVVQGPPTWRKPSHGHSSYTTKCNYFIRSARLNNLKGDLCPSPLLLLPYPLSLYTQCPSSWLIPASFRCTSGARAQLLSCEVLSRVYCLGGDNMVHSLTHGAVLRIPY